MSGQRDRETILLTVDEIGDRFVDLGPASTVLALARELNGSDDSIYLSLYVHRLARTLAPNLPALSADIRSGDVVRVVLAEAETGRVDDQQAVDAAGDPAVGGIQGATLHMLSGPLTGSSYQLSPGDNQVGRVSENDVVLVDAGISRHHATITLDSSGVSVVDNNSTNGIRVDGQPIKEPTRIQSGQRILLGRCWAAIAFAETVPDEEITERERAKELLALAPVPRDVTRFQGETITLPEPPATDARRTGDRFAADQINLTVETLTNQLVEAQQAEVAARAEEAPAIYHLADQLFVDRRPNPSLLWQRQVDDLDGLEVRLGLATQPSRTSVVVPTGHHAELQDRLDELPERFGTVAGVPAVVNLRVARSIGVSGQTDQALAVTRSLIAQLATLHGPDQLGVLHRSGAPSRQWDWLKWLPHVGLAGSRAGVPPSEFVSTVSAMLAGPTAGPSGVPHPPATVVLIDDPAALPPALFPRLIQEGPDVGLYPILVAEDLGSFATTPETIIVVTGDEAHVTMADGSHIGAIAAEPLDLSTAELMVRSMASVGYEPVLPLTPMAQSEQPPPDALFVGRFELGGSPPPQWPSVAQQSQPEDTSIEDTAVEDTGVENTEVQDTEVQDTGVENGVVPPSSAPDLMFPPPPSESQPAEAQLVAPAAPETNGNGAAPAADVATSDPALDVTSDTPATPSPDPNQNPTTVAEPSASNQVAAPPVDAMLPPPPPPLDAMLPPPPPPLDAMPPPPPTTTPPTTTPPPLDAMPPPPPGIEHLPPPSVTDTPTSAPVETPADPPAPVETPADPPASVDIDLREPAPSEPAPSAAPVTGPPPDQPPAMPKLLLSALPPAEGDGRLILGTVQVPDRPNPAVFAMNLPRDGSLGLVGPTGSGRTSALHSVAAATAMLSVHPDSIPLVYYLDVPGRLELIGSLPNAVGAAGNDIDGFRLVTTDLERLLVDRRAAFDELGAADLEEYRDLQPGANLRRIVTLIDNVSAFAELMEAIQPGRWAPLLASMLSDGPALGVHLVFTADSHNVLGPDLGRQVGRWLPLGGGKDGVIRPGRAMVGKNEVRFAVVSADDDPGPVIARIGAELVAAGATPLAYPSGPAQIRR